jgi:hypothetical protein
MGPVVMTVQFPLTDVFPKARSRRQTSLKVAGPDAPPNTGGHERSISWLAKLRGWTRTNKRV